MVDLPDGKAPAYAIACKISPNLGLTVYNILLSTIFYHAILRFSSSDLWVLSCFVIMRFFSFRSRGAEFVCFAGILIKFKIYKNTPL